MIVLMMLKRSVPSTKTRMFITVVGMVEFIRFLSPTLRTGVCKGQSRSEKLPKFGQVRQRVRVSTGQDKGRPLGNVLVGSSFGK